MIKVRKGMRYKVLLEERIFEPEKFFPQCHASTQVVLNHEKDEILASWFGGTQGRGKSSVQLASISLYYSLTIGRVKYRVVPCPLMLSAHILPPCSSIMCLHIARPNPIPP